MFTAMNCACMSVGNSGYSLVRMLTERGRPAARTRIQSSPHSISVPASRSLSITTSRWSARTSLSSTSPPAAATAHRKVPASMRSGMTRCPPAGACSRSTPSMRMRLPPWPSMRAPMRISSSARSVTSGSCAAFSSTVSPSASVAAISRFSVPVTVIMSVLMRAPFSRAFVPLTRATM